MTNPYRQCASEQAENTTTLYDALSRPVSITTADGSKTSMSYAGNQTTITDPASVTRTTTTDALGRITSVLEANTLLTTYSYDPLIDLVTVCQGGQISNGICPSGVQSRTFAYDSLARLTSAINPESGATYYVYDKNGNLITKTDANNNVTSISYDALNRVTTKNYTTVTAYSTPNVTYCYDGTATGACASAPTGTSNYLVGRLTMVQSSASTTTYAQFDNLGDILKSSQTTGGYSYPFGYGYNLANAMTGMTLPSGHTESWTYDVANRIATASATPPNGTAQTYASNIQYASQGPISQMTLGNGLVEARSYDTWRQQPIGVTLGTSTNLSSVTSLGFSYCSNGGQDCTNNNGNLQSQTIQPLGATQTYAYDSYNRLTQGTEMAGSTTIWSEGFGTTAMAIAGCRARAEFRSPR